MKHTHTHTPEDGIVTKPSRGCRVPDQHFPTQMGLDGRHSPEPSGKSARAARGARKGSRPAHQRPSDSPGLGVAQLVQRRLSVPPRKSAGRQSVPSRGKKQGGSPKQTASAAVRTIPSNPSWGLRAASSVSSRPPLRAFKVAAPLHPAAGYRESSASRGRPSRRAKPLAPTERQG